MLTKKNRHWEVFYSGTIVVLVFWIITPMQGAIFGTSSILSRHQTNMTYSNGLIHAADQPTKIDQSVLNAGYAATWLNQPYPPFTTADYAVLPFQPSSVQQVSAANWTGTTTKYWTELDCKPATIFPVLGLNPGTADFLDGKGCNVSRLDAYSTTQGQNSPYRMLYIGYQDSAYADYSLGSGGACGPQAWNEFLATWGWSDGTSSNVSLAAAFCETRYFKQNVSITVSATERRPLDGTSTPLASPEELHETEFNTSAFQYLLTAGVSSADIPRDYPFRSLLSHYYRVSTLGLQIPLTPMTALAVGGQNLTADAYSNIGNLHKAYETVHKMLFSLAFQNLLQNATREEQVQGDAFTVQYAVTVNRLFSALVEGILLLVAVMTMTLLYRCRRRTSLLSSDPSALGSLVAFARDDTKLRDIFSGTGHMSDEVLLRKLGQYRFRLCCGCHDFTGQNGTKISVIGSPDYESEDSNCAKTKQEFSSAGYLAPVKPLVLRKVSGFLFIVVLGGAAAALIYFKRQDAIFGGKVPSRCNHAPTRTAINAIFYALPGLSRPSNNAEVNQILTNYLPTAFSTLVEPLWVLLNRYLCILQPFYDLSTTGRSPATMHTTMETRYTALPPQLAFVRAVKSGHFLLAGVCVTALLANVLSVGLGALFNDVPKQAIRPQAFIPSRLPTIPNDNLLQFLGQTAMGISTTYSDPYYVLIANLTFGTSLPPWLSAEYSFLPVNISHSENASLGEGADTLFTVNTTGVGIEPGCKPVGVFPSVDQPANVSSSLIIPSSVSAAGGGVCAGEYISTKKGFNNTASGLLPDTMPVAAEIVDTLTDSFVANETTCDETLILGWSRSGIVDSTHGRASQTAYMACTPRLRMATFQVTMDSAGHILAATPLSNFISSWPYDDMVSSTVQQPVFNAINFSLRNRLAPWHATTLTYDWFNYLLVLYNKSRATVDPAAPLPNVTALVPAVESVYKMVFAAFLALNPELFAENVVSSTSSSSSSVLRQGMRTAPETRMSMSTPAFIVSIVIIALYVFVALAYYAFGVKFFLPRMPSTLGSLLAYVAPSAIVEDSRLSRHKSSSTDAVSSRHTSRALLFGRYTGHDSHGQVGISYAEKTVPLNMETLSIGDTRPSRFKFLHRRGAKRAADVWL